MDLKHLFIPSTIKVVKKICTRCKLEQSLDEFNFKNKARGRLNSHCKSCSRNYIRQHYLRNTAYYLRKARLRNNKIALISRQYIWDYLSKHPCTDCGETDPIVLEFDHISDKRYDVSAFSRREASLAKLESEIAKCEIRCANCHRRKTAKQLGWYNNLNLDKPL